MPEFLKIFLGLIIMALTALFHTLTGYRVRKITVFCVWLYIAVNCWIYIFGPAIAAYGFWPMLGTILAYTIAANVASFAFFYMRKPAVPQATPKEKHHA